jgi:hypothetical protein
MDLLVFCEGGDETESWIEVERSVYFFIAISQNYFCLYEPMMF